MKRKPGRKKIAKSPPMSCQYTDLQTEWLKSKVAPGGTVSEVLRRLVDTAMRKEGIKIK